MLPSLRRALATPLLFFLALACARGQGKTGGPAPLPQADILPSKKPAPTQQQVAATRRPAPPVDASPAPAPALPPPLRNIPPFDGKVAWDRDGAVRSENGVVSSVESAATHAGASVLEQGGNAIDAAVATALSLAVTHPSAGNLGGGGFALVKRGNKLDAIDFREDAPHELPLDGFWKMIGHGGRGPLSVGVPGTVAGLYLAHQRHGRLAWAAVVDPALRLARDGYKLGLRQAQTIAWAKERLNKDPVAREVFFSQGRPKTPGSLIRRPRLALALARIQSEGPRGFYEGPTARDLVETLGPQGTMTLDDLKGYRAKLREPLYFNFGPYRIITMPPPSAGGTALAQNLKMLWKWKVGQTRKDSPERFHLLAEASRRAQIERQLQVVAPEVLSQQQSSEARRRSLDADTWLKDFPLDPLRASQSRDLSPAYKHLSGESEHTTHLSVVDGEGNLVSLTVTLSGSYGSAIFSKKTGVALNNSVASFSAIGKNTPRPGVRTTSSMAPTFALLGQELALVLGSPGGDTIPSTITQVLLHLIYDGDSLRSAVAKPRVHQGFIPQHLTTERFAPLPAALVEQLNRRGHDVSPARYAMGDANIAAWLGSSAIAVVDPREGGLAWGARASGSGTQDRPSGTP